MKLNSYESHNTLANTQYQMINNKAKYGQILRTVKRKKYIRPSSRVLGYHSVPFKLVMKGDIWVKNDGENDGLK